MTAAVIGLVLGLGLIGYGWYFRRAGHSNRSPWVAIFYLMLPVAPWALVQISRGRGSPTEYAELLISGSGATLFGAFLYATFVYFYASRVDGSQLRADRERRLARLYDRGLREEQAERLRKRIVFFTSPGFFACYIFLGLGLAGVLLTRKVLEWTLL